jgi:hypothetical protein
VVVVVVAVVVAVLVAAAVPAVLVAAVGEARPRSPRGVLTDDGETGGSPDRGGSPPPHGRRTSDRRDVVLALNPIASSMSPNPLTYRQLARPTLPDPTGPSHDAVMR